MVDYMDARGACPNCGQFKGWAGEPPHKCPDTVVTKYDFGGFDSLRLANAMRQREWDSENKIDIAYRGNELAGECGEACNVIKKLERERRGIRGSRDTLEHLAEELADVIICVDLIAMSEDINLWEAVRNKFNKTSSINNLSTKIK